MFYDFKKAVISPIVKGRISEEEDTTYYWRGTKEEVVTSSENDENNTSESKANVLQIPVLKEQDSDEESDGQDLEEISEEQELEHDESLNENEELKNDGLAEAGVNRQNLELNFGKSNISKLKEWGWTKDRIEHWQEETNAINNEVPKCRYRHLGTSLIVLLDDPRRLSTDIDILVEPGTDIDDYIQRAGVIFPFKRVEEHNRKKENNIEKRHFRFYFDSPRSGDEIRVLLDVVFEENPYPNIVEKEINSNLLLTEGENLIVRIPDKNCILGDKLTAFAPHTTGIPFGKDKELEIIKQMFDCWTILREMDDFDMVTQVYEMISRLEMGYRNLELTPADCLLDTIRSCICILGTGSIREEDYKNFLTGIAAIQTHIFKGKMNGEVAEKCASEVMYLAACIMTGNRYERISDPESYRSVKLLIKGIKKVSGLKNVDISAYAYMVRAFQMLMEHGLFSDSVMD